MASSSTDESREFENRRPRNTKLINQSADNDTKHEQKKKKKYKSKTQPSESSTVKHRNNPPKSPEYSTVKQKNNPPKSPESSTLKHKKNPPTSPRYAVECNSNDLKNRRNVHKRKYVEANPAAKTVSLVSTDVEDYEQRPEEPQEEKHEVTDAEDVFSEEKVEVTDAEEYIFYEGKIEGPASKRSKLNSGVPNKNKSSATNSKSHDAKMEATKEMLKKRYQEVADKRKKRSVQVLDPKDTPNQRIDNPSWNRFFSGKRKNFKK